MEDKVHNGLSSASEEKEGEKRYKFEMSWTNLLYVLLVLIKQYKKTRKVIESLQGMIRKQIITCKVTVRW